MVVIITDISASVADAVRQYADPLNLASQADRRQQLLQLRWKPDDAQASSQQVSDVMAKSVGMRLQSAHQANA